MRTGLNGLLCTLVLLTTTVAQTASTAAAKQQVLWQKLETKIADIDRNLDGVMGVAIEDLTSGQKFALRGDDVFPQASSIKTAVLAELYRPLEMPSAMK